jgi:hypothetical protein
MVSLPGTPLLVRTWVSWQSRLVYDRVVDYNSNAPFVESGIMLVQAHPEGVRLAQLGAPFQNWTRTNQALQYVTSYSLSSNKQAIKKLVKKN